MVEETAGSLTGVYPPNALEEAMLEFHGMHLAASIISLTEALVHPIRAGRSDAVRELIRRAAIEALADTPGDEIELALLRAETRLALPDCCVLLAALSCQGQIVTFDARLASVARKCGIEVVGAG